MFNGVYMKEFISSTKMTNTRPSHRISEKFLGRHLVDYLRFTNFKWIAFRRNYR